MDKNTRLKRITAMLLAIILISYAAPVGTANEPAEWGTIYSEWWRPDLKTATAEYTFSGVGDTVLLPYLLGLSGIHGHITDAVTDSEAVELDDSLYLKAVSYFDSAELTVTVKDRTYVFILHNPGEEPVIPAGTEVTGDDGSFTAASTVPAGTRLAIGAFEPTENLRTAVQAEDEGAVTVWMDIDLLAPDGETVHAGADVYVKTQIELPAAPETDGLTGHAVLRDARLYHVTGEGEMEELPVEVETEEGYITALRFSTESFSGFALSYTVDFTYEGRAWSFPGQGSYRLADVLAALGIEGSIDEAALTLIVGEDHAGALYLTRSDDEYYINSEIAFADTYELAVRIGEKIFIITVTDSQESRNLSDFLKNAIITGATQDSAGQYHVESGQEYSIILTFAEDSSNQFADNQPLTYRMPEGITILEQQEGDANINIVYKGRTYQVGYHYILNTDGSLEIRFDTDDPDFPRLQDSTNVSFRFTYYGRFEENVTQIVFSDGVERDIIFDEPEAGQAYVEKTGAFDQTTGTMHYTIKVTADGDVENVNVRDVLSGDALIFNNGIQISGNSSSYTDNGASNGFDYTFASMRDGETIIITYSANVDFGKDTDKDGKITVDQTKNSVTVEPDDGDPHSSEYSREINYMTTSKGAGTDGGTAENGDKILNWTIDYNPLALASAAGFTVKDTIGASSQAYMKYYGSGITVEVRNHSGALVETRQIDYSNLTAHSDSTWTYTIPETDIEPYHYIITYQTVVDMEKVNGGGVSVHVDNTANGNTTGTDISPAGEIGVTKNVESFNTQEVTWTATLSIPENGLTQAVVTDTLPVFWHNSKNNYDVFKDDSLKITGLLSGETYAVTVTEDKVEIIFYQDAGNGLQGLKGQAGGRTVTVRLTTKVNQDWLEASYEDESPNWWKDHVNTIDFNGKSAQATVTFSKPGIKKTGVSLGNGSFMYTVLLSGVSEAPVSVKDTFDTSLLEVDTSKASTWFYMKIWGGEQYSQDAGGIPISYTDAPDGILLTANSVPMMDNGQYYPYYKITYYLKLKDGVDLEQLAIANGGEHHLVNTAKWGDHESEFDYKTTYDYLDKKLLNENELGGIGRTARYQITFNSAKATLNGGEPMEMTDTISANLSVDYSSISIVTDPAGQAVPYSLSGGKDENGDSNGTTVATYSIPDSTKVVITYEASVRGTGSQTIVNKVTVNGQEETVTTEKSYGSNSEGEGAVASFKIVKVDGYDANKKLEGVQFKIFAENPNIYFDKDKTVKELILPTDENGEILLDGDLYQLYFDECYHIQEVAPLPDYGTISFDYLVTLTNEMSKVDYKHYIYYYNDQMQIKNWPLEGLVVEKHVESTNDADKERYYLFRVSILNDDGTVNKEYNEKNGDDQFVEGSFKFELKDKEQKMFWGFNKGTKYKVEEIDSNGLAVSVTYNVYNADGDVIQTITDQTASHTGTLMQQNEVIIFKNAAEIPVAVKIPVIKVLQGRDMEEGEFAFILQPIDINGIRKETGKQIAYNPAGLANQEVTFNFTLEYDEEDIADAPYKDDEGNGVYFYVVYEEQGEVEGIHYSEQQYIVRVTLTQNENGNLVAIPQYYLYNGEGPLPDDAIEKLNLQQPVILA
ncbi:MAG: hypothetical protein IKE24_07395 [Clostridia bacterium]|nr:hypothetical protein [Clostridia bacterium]